MTHFEVENDALRFKLKGFYEGITFWSNKDTPEELKSRIIDNFYLAAFVPTGCSLDVHQLLDGNYRKIKVDRGFLFYWKM